MSRVGVSANDAIVESFIVIVTATLNRAQNIFDAFFTTDIGTNIVTKIRADASTVVETLLTVLIAVRHDDSQFILSPVRIVLIMITVPLMMALTVSIKVNSARRPTANFVIVTKVKAFTIDMKTERAGTRAVP